MHKEMSREVVKKLVVSIKQMEADLTFYENNWHLFKSASLDYAPGLRDEQMPVVNLDQPEIIREGSESRKRRHNNH